MFENIRYETSPLKAHFKGFNGSQSRENVKIISLRRQNEWIKIFPFITVCNIIVHEKCMKTVALACISIAATLVKVNIAYSLFCLLRI